MKLENLVGKFAVRTRTLSSIDFLGRENNDSSFTWEPVFVEAVIDGVVFIRREPNELGRILSARYVDEHWSPVPDQYLPEKWKAPQQAEAMGRSEG